HNSVEYKRISPKNIDYDKSPDTTYIEDGEWVVARYLMTPSDIVDRFYDSLEEHEVADLDAGHYSISPSNMFSFLAKDAEGGLDKVDVYHVVWKSFQKVGFRIYYSETTGELEQDIVTDD